MENNSLKFLPNSIKLAVLVAALGYFVDAFDLMLFSILRVQSLKDLGLEGEDLLAVGKDLINWQMLGLLVGGLFWGILGDRIGRIQVLFGSILLYSVATFLNGFVESVSQYAILRFVAGFGLAGELGGGVTLVAELLPKEKRGLGTTVVATIGVSGVVVAGLIGKLFTWRYVYMLGGTMGFLLLLLRIGVSESGIFNSVKEKEVKRGDFFMLFTSYARFFRYLSCIAIAIPTWFLVGILITFCPEIGVAKGIVEPLSAGDALIWCYVGLTLGDLTCGLISQWLQSRKKAISLFLVGEAISIALIFFLPIDQPWQFYALSVPAGFFVGYWVVFVTTAAEQFGTNLRATVATTAPNFVRATTIPMVSAFVFFKGSGIGVLESAAIVGLVSIGLGFIGAFNLKESFHLDLDYLE
jgi:putative MFS transporter